MKKLWCCRDLQGSMKRSQLLFDLYAYFRTTARSWFGPFSILYCTIADISYTRGLPRFYAKEHREGGRRQKCRRKGGRGMLPCAPLVPRFCLTLSCAFLCSFFIYRRRRIRLGLLVCSKAAQWSTRPLRVRSGGTAQLVTCQLDPIFTTEFGHKTKTPLHIRSLGLWPS